MALCQQGGVRQQRRAPSVVAVMAAPNRVVRLEIRGIARPAHRC
jgi:hypothetical protein